MGSGADIVLRPVDTGPDVRLYPGPTPRADITLRVVGTDPVLRTSRTTAPAGTAPPVGVTHDGQWASVGTSTTTFAGNVNAAGTWTSTGTSTSSFNGELVGAAPPTARLGRPITGPRVTRTSPRRR